MKTESTDMQERAQQLWRELDGLDWSSHEQAIVGILRDALEQAYQDGREVETVRNILIDENGGIHGDVSGLKR